MNLIDRAKNIIANPRQEWLVIATETDTINSLLTKYVLPLSLLPAIGTILGSLIWSLGFTYGLVTAVIGIIGTIISYYVGSYVVDALAPSFQSEKNINRSAQLIGYSWTPALVAGFLGFIPVIGWLIMLAGWGYSAYVMYLGVTPVKKTPQDRAVMYVVIAIIVVIAISAIFGFIIAAAIVRSMFTPHYYYP
ncbi:MAG: YIP1 family protein [Chitinophagaceae bacterium]|nr:YIP1 family protein [Chitinophagaceae bacterium]